MVSLKRRMTSCRVSILILMVLHYRFSLDLLNIHKAGIWKDVKTGGSKPAALVQHARTAMKRHDGIERKKRKHEKKGSGNEGEK